MPRLRTTTVLSLLALTVGVGGTQWLSAQAGGRHGLAAAAARPPAATQLHWRHGPPTVIAGTLPFRPATPLGDASGVTRSAARPAPPALVPVRMPPAEAAYATLRGHLRGRVVLHLTLDGRGEVRRAVVNDSSGDPILDAHALATVSRWRFAVPAGYPAGFSGDLPMRFDTSVARAP